MSERETHNIDDESEMTVEQCISKLINKVTNTIILKAPKISKTSRD